MKETKFIEQNKEKWADFESQMRGGGREPQELNDLFIQITDDLSYARTYYPNRSVRMYLNNLAQKIFHNIYRGKRLPGAQIKLFWSQELPRLMWEERRAFLLSFCLFALAFGIGVLSSIINPDFARVILGDGYVQMTLQNIENGDPMAVYKESKPLGMTLGIAFNNLRVALMTAALGVAASLGTVFIMLYNGIMVGAFQYFFIEKGLFWESFLTIWIHGTLEISAIIIAGAAGLVAGSGLLFPGTYRRSQAFQLSLRRALKIFFGIVPIIILAAIFEGFFTRYTNTPAIIRGGIIIVSLIFILWYFVWYPRHLVKSGRIGPEQDIRALPPDKTEPIYFGNIKTGGEILTDAFSIIRRRSRLIVGSVLAATVVFIVIAYGLSAKPAGETFFWEKGGMFRTLGYLDNFFDSRRVPFIFYFQMFILSGLGVVAFATLLQEMPEEEREGIRFGRLLLSVLLLLGPAAVIPQVLRINIGIFSWLFAMALSPLMAMWGALMFFENPNPLTSLIRNFSIFRWGNALGLGFITIGLGGLLFLFIDTSVWSLILDLFGWLVPSSKESANQTYYNVATTFSSAFVMYFLYFIIMLCGGLLYFSSREVSDADTLRKHIKTIGANRQIRGLPRE